MKDLNEFSEANVILVDVVREVHILKERISDTAAGTLAIPVWWWEDEVTYSHSLGSPKISRAAKMELQSPLRLL